MVPEVDRSIDILNSYKTCNPDIVDILSQMKCMVDNDEINQNDINSNTTCHQSQRGLFLVTNKLYSSSGHTLSLIIPGGTTWNTSSRFLETDGHYIIEAGVFALHSFFIEIKDKKFRLLSLWEGIYGFLEFPTRSDWGMFDGHDDYEVFLDTLKVINGGIDLDTSGDHNYNKYAFTRTEANLSAQKINEIFSSDVPVAEVFESNFNQKGMFVKPKYVVKLDT